jgi:Cu/Ag efflux pump CusA
MPCGEVLFVVNRVNQSTFDDVKRRSFIGFNVVGRDIGGVVYEARKTLAAQIRLPRGYTMEWGSGVWHVWLR